MDDTAGFTEGRALLLKVRESRSLSQLDVATECKVWPQIISNLETGKTPAPSLRLAIALEDTFEIPVRSWFQPARKRRRTAA